MFSADRARSIRRSLLHTRLYPDMDDLSAPGRRGHPACGAVVLRCLRCAAAGISGNRAGYCRTQGADRHRDRFRAQPAAGPDQRHRRQGSGFHLSQRRATHIHRAVAAATFSVPQFFSRHDRLRHPAPLRRRTGQEGFSGAARSEPRSGAATAKQATIRRSCAGRGWPPRRVAGHFALDRSNRCRASLSRSSTNLTAASLDIGPVVIGSGILADRLVDIIFAVVSRRTVHLKRMRGHRAGADFRNSRSAGAALGGDRGRFSPARPVRDGVAG